MHRQEEQRRAARKGRRRTAKRRTEKRQRSKTSQSHAGGQLGGGAPPAAALLFKSDVSQVSVIDTDDAVVLLEQALLLGLASPLQTLDQQAKSPETFKSSCQERATQDNKAAGFKAAAWLCFTL